MKSANLRSQYLEDYSQGQGRKQVSQEMTQAHIRRASWGNDRFQCHWPRIHSSYHFPPGISCHQGWGIEGLQQGCPAQKLVYSWGEHWFLTQSNEGTLSFNLLLWNGFYVHATLRIFQLEGLISPFEEVELWGCGQQTEPGVIWTLSTHPPTPACPLTAPETLIYFFISLFGCATWLVGS